MRAVVAHVQVPFVVGGAELLVDKLVRALKDESFEVEVISVPLTDSSNEGLKKQIQFWSEVKPECDVVISTKFPSYFINHPNHICWLVHQHRQCYDLLGSAYGGLGATREDEEFRRFVKAKDKEQLSSVRKLATISQNVTKRLQTYLSLPSVVLEPPLPLENRYESKPPQNFILSVGRLCSIKRVDMLLNAAPHLNPDIRIVIVGSPAEKGIMEHYQSLISKHHLEKKVTLAGRVSEEELIELYATCHSVYYAPYDEDYGFVTLEAMASGKPVVTTTDAGGVLDFIEHEEQGLVAEPTPESVARAFNELFTKPELYKKCCENTRPSSMTWSELAKELLS